MYAAIIRLSFFLMTASPIVYAQKLSKSSTVKLRLPEHCGFFYDGVQVLDWNRKVTVALLYREIRMICLFNLENGEIVQCLKYDAEGPDGVGYEISGFWVESPDEIYLYSYWEFTLFKVNANGKVLNKWKLPIEKTNLPIIELGTSTPLLKFDNDLIMSGSVFSIAGDPVKNPIVHLDITTGNIRCTGLVPLDMQKNYYSLGSILHYDYAEDKNYFIVDFGASDSVYLMRGNLFYANLAESKYIDHIPSLCPIPCNKTITKEMTLRQSAVGGYLGVRYDEYNQCYYRFVAGPKEIEAIKGGDLMRKQSVLVLDLNLRTKQEIDLPYGSIAELAFVTKFGLMVPNITPYQYESDDYLYFDVYNFR